MTDISIPTPANISIFESSSIKAGVTPTIRINRVYVVFTNFSIDFLSTCGERVTVNLSIFLGNGTGPTTRPPTIYQCTNYITSEYKASSTSTIVFCISKYFNEYL